MAAPTALGSVALAAASVTFYTVLWLCVYAGTVWPLSLFDSGTAGGGGGGGSSSSSSGDGGSSSTTTTTRNTNRRSRVSSSSFPASGAPRREGASSGRNGEEEEAHAHNAALSRRLLRALLSLFAPGSYQRGSVTADIGSSVDVDGGLTLLGGRATDASCVCALFYAFEPIAMVGEATALPSRLLYQVYFLYLLSRPPTHWLDFAERTARRTFCVISAAAAAGVQELQTTQPSQHTRVLYASSGGTSSDDDYDVGGNNGDGSEGLDDAVAATAVERYPTGLGFRFGAPPPRSEGDEGQEAQQRLTNRRRLPGHTRRHKKLVRCPICRVVSARRHAVEGVRIPAPAGAW